MNQSRFRSKTAWMAVVSLVLFILKTYFNIDIPCEIIYKETSIKFFTEFFNPDNHKNTSIIKPLLLTMSLKHDI